MTSASARQKIKVQNQGFLRKLPLLDFTASLHPHTNLKGVYLICAQHLVSSTYALFDTLLKLGLNANNISAIGKCYSTDPSAYEEMKKNGIDVCSSSLIFNSHSSFDEQYRSNIRNFVSRRAQKLTSDKFEKIIALDDGGELIPVVCDHLQNYKHVVGIEQTSSGFNKLNETKIRFPIINVARSPAKLNYESPIIAKLVAETLIRRLGNIPLQPKHVLIIGNGPIGSQIGEALKGSFNVSIFDRVSSKSSIRKNDLFKALKKSDLIIGCTGKSVLPSQHLGLLKKNAILVSASSSDREFDAVELRRRIPVVADCHSDLFVDGVYLINCGFPINFAAEYREIDCDELQLTRSLLLSAILQAYYHCDAERREFVPLDIGNQRDIIRRFIGIFPIKREIEELVVQH